MKPAWWPGLGLLSVGLVVASGCERSPALAPRTTASARERTNRVEQPAELVAEPTGRTVVVWISVDGMRGDYVDQAQTPFFHRLMKEGAFTRRLVPVFPSLTFPSHVSEVTGASVNRHGIIGNAIFDRKNDRRWSHPNVASEILCEPIWTTVKRGGPRVLVHDWPVSQQQVGEFKADYFDRTFDTGLSDLERLNRLIDTWSNDKQAAPLQLIMGYVIGPDKAGHKYGPNAPPTKAAVEETDHLLGDFFQRVQAVFAKKMSRSDTLYFLMTTDHGMEDVKVMLNLRLMCGSAWSDEMRLVVSSSVGNIFLDRLGPPPVRQQIVQKLLEVLETYGFAHAYAREDLPEPWDYGHLWRTGDVVISLDPGFMFSEKEGPAMRVIEPAEGPLGMHGYPPADFPHMWGFMAIWRSGKPLGGIDMGELDSRRLHATVAKWLGVKPAETAVQEAIALP